MSRNHRSAFTLVELLVVIAIIGILVGLLLPAVQAAREAARRMQCSNNLKQLALGLHNYHSTYDTFPAGVRGGNSSGTGADTEGFGVSFFYGMLPYFEQGPLYDKITMVGTTPFGGQQHPGWTGCPLANGPAGSLNGTTVNQVVIATFNCPSNPMDTNPKDGGSGSFANLPSYIGISGGVDEDKTSAAGPPAPGAAGDTDGFQSIRQRPGSDCCSANATNGYMSSGGVLVQHDYNGFKHIKDGTSNVIMLGEVGNWMRDASNNPVDARVNHGWLMGTNGNGRIRNWDGSNQRTFNLTAIRYPINTKTYNLPGVEHNYGPNNPLVSAHTGGVQVGLADGSVRFMTDSTNLPLLKMLATRDSGQPKTLP